MKNVEIPLRGGMLAFEAGNAAGSWWRPAGGFHFHDAYLFHDPEEVRERWLVWDPKGDGRRYAVLSRRRLLPDFAALATDPRDDAIRSFANSYGLLGVVEGWVSRAGGSRPHAGERVSRWRQEMARFTAVWELANRERRPRGRNDDLARKISDMLDQHARVGLLVREHRDAPDEFIIRQVPKTLLGAVYLQLAQRLAHAELAQRLCGNPLCPYGGVFQPRRRDQRFCRPNCRAQANYLVRSQRVK